MITRRELRQQAVRQGVALGALEKDCILTLVLRHLYAEEAWRETLVIKGGTHPARRPWPTPTARRSR